jgi:hypothetical protein
VPEVWVALWNPAAKVTFWGTELSSHLHSTVWPALMVTEVGTKLTSPSLASVAGELPIMTMTPGSLPWAVVDVPVTEETGTFPLGGPPPT